MGVSRDCVSNMDGKVKMRVKKDKKVTSGDEKKRHSFTRFASLAIPRVSVARFASFLRKCPFNSKTASSCAQTDCNCACRN